MIWGSVAGYLSDRAARWLLPGLERNISFGDQVILTQSERIATGYNSILDRVDGETVVLLHDDVELGDGARGFILEALETADIVGVVGGSDLDQLAWWTAKTKRGFVRHGDGGSSGVVRFGDYGEVDAIDGLLMAFRPEVAAVLRFDEDYPGFHGYDVDFCYQALNAGFKIVTAEIPLVHHTKGGFGDKAVWNACAERWRQKWGA